MPCMKCRLTCEADAGTLGTQRYQKQGGATSELGGDSGNVRTCTVCGQWRGRERERQRRIGEVAGWGWESQLGPSPDRGVSQVQWRRISLLTIGLTQT